MEIITHAPGIIEIKNFISDDEIKELLSFINNFNEDDWINKSKGFGSWEGNVISLGSSMKKTILKNIDSRLESIFSSLEKKVSLSVIHRLKTGNNIDKHRDNNSQDNLIYGIVIYINEDFKGGEIFYPGLDIEYKPNAGSLLIHYAGLYHEVSPVTQGVRYFLTSFISGTKENPAILNIGNYDN